MSSRTLVGLLLEPQLVVDRLAATLGISLRSLRAELSHYASSLASSDFHP